ncbi:DNA cytosine methyltransferase [soil metagenome]
MSIPVIDIFAGPGGLGEGFSSVFDKNGDRFFKTVLSIEMEQYAHETLTLRSFYRQFNPEEVPEEYYQVLRGEISTNELYQLNKFKEQAEAAKKEAKWAKLGYSDDSADPALVDEWITEALEGEKDWILTGGPPCQAYSVVGRSRRQETVLDAEKDERVDLYKQYLRILEKHKPSVFIMENVKGMLSARSARISIFEKIMSDLKAPGYKIFSLVRKSRNDLFNEPEFLPRDFVIKAEEYGIPQARHRVILLGIRDDIFKKPPQILKKKPSVSVEKVIGDLPRLRSSLSKQTDTWENWSETVKIISSNGVMEQVSDSVASNLLKVIQRMRRPHKKSGAEFVPYRKNYVPVEYESKWFHDEKIGGACNHASRGHMDSDLHRYLFASVFAKEFGRSPKLVDFPEKLLPAHKNVKESIRTKKFADRFRVQLKNSPAKTITSHISKDGHYYIHPDPTQCRSFTVREAARIQTFPDNYFFCGSRTAQYIQVGNAVPPLLAKNIAKTVLKLFKK